MKKLKIAVFGDLHLGHPKNKAAHIIGNFKKLLPNNAETGELDIIFFAGDVFDDLLTLSSDELTEIILWMDYLFFICATHNIVLRILEGTKSHDWSQSKRFIDIAATSQHKVDIKYIKELSIEYIEQFDINVLYVPDEWQSSTEKTLVEVKALLSSKGLSAVDYAIMHGAFEHQLPEIVKSHKHNPDEYLKIVKKLIFIGHIHTYSKYDRIIAQGSTDRLAHGEEEAKGYVVATVTEDDYNIAFIENKDAKIFKSIDCIGLSLDETIERIDSVISESNFPSGSYIRVVGNADNPIFANMNTLIRRYPLLVWSKLAKDVDDTAIVESEDEYHYIPITITNDNIKDLLMERIALVDVGSNVVLAAEELLEEVV